MIAKSGRLMVPAALDVHVYSITSTGFACTRDDAGLCEAWHVLAWKTWMFMQDSHVVKQRCQGKRAVWSCWCEHGDQGGRCGCHLRACLDMRASENGIACEQMLRCALSVRIRTANQLAGNGGPSSRVPRFTAQHVWSVDERIVAKPACAGESTL